MDFFQLAVAAPVVLTVRAAVAGERAPEPITVVGGLPASTTTLRGGVTKAAVVAPATVAADGTSAGTQLNLLILSLRAAGVIV